MQLLSPFGWRVSFYPRGLFVSISRKNGYRQWHRLGPGCRMA